MFASSLLHAVRERLYQVADSISIAPLGRVVGFCGLNRVYVALLPKKSYSFYVTNGKRVAGAYPRHTLRLSNE